MKAALFGFNNLGLSLFRAILLMSVKLFSSIQNTRFKLVDIADIAPIVSLTIQKVYFMGFFTGK